MKKYNIFKVVGITILVVTLLTWIFPATSYSYGELVNDGTRSQVGLFNLFTYPIESMTYFGNVILYILAIGGFYGILHKVGAYRSVLDKLSKKQSPLVLVCIMVLFALFTAVCGASQGLWIVIPFVVSLVLLMGYDKVTAAMVTVGSIAVGMIGSLFSSIYISDMSGVSAQNGIGVVNTILSTHPLAQTLPKIIILCLSLGLLIFNTLRYASKNKVDKKVAEKELVPTVVDKKAKKWPLIVVFDLTFLITLLSQTAWSSVFKIKFFSDITTSALTKLNIKGFPIIGKILGSVPAFENWGLPELTVLLVIASIVISLIYRVKFNEYLDDALEGIKKALKPAAIVIFIYVVLIMVTYNGTVLTIVKPFLKAGKLNAPFMAVAAFISSLLNVDLLYAASSTLQYVVQILPATAMHSTIAFIWQIMYGFTSLIAPTSVMLMGTLAYLNIPYGKWIKSNWILILGILACCIILSTVLAMRI
ncbi:MAG: hypothetical protein J6W64_11555, partial [Bacilli bacterium]|nr:hypothetical protein [Bacilli bacterium]